MTKTLHLQKNNNMKLNIGITLLLSGMMIFNSCANEGSKKADAKAVKSDTAKNENQEGVFLDYNVQDVGAIPRDKPITTQTVITNNKPDTLMILDPSTTCDCMKVDLRKRKLAPKDTAIMTVTYNARIPGLFDKDVYVNYVGQDSTLKYTMKGHVKQ